MISIRKYTRYLDILMVEGSISRFFVVSHKDIGASPFQKSYIVTFDSDTFSKCLILLKLTINPCVKQCKKLRIPYTWHTDVQQMCLPKDATVVTEII